MTANTTNAGFMVKEWRPYVKNTLQGFLSLELPSGLVLHGFTLHQKNGSRWVSPPAKEFTKADGTKSWVPQIDFVSKEVREKFQAEALRAVDRHLGKEEL